MTFSINDYAARYLNSGPNIRWSDQYDINPCKTIKIPRAVPVSNISSRVINSNLIFKIIAPSMDRESLEVTFHKNTVQVKYRLKDLYRVDGPYTNEEHWIELPKDLKYEDWCEADVDYEDGVLSIFIPLKTETFRLLGC